MSVRLRRLSHAGHVSQVRQVTQEDGKGARTHEAREARRLCKAWGCIRHAGRLSHEGTWRMWTCMSCRGNRVRTARRHVRYFSTLIKISVLWNMKKKTFRMSFVISRITWFQAFRFQCLDLKTQSFRSIQSINCRKSIELSFKVCINFDLSTLTLPKIKLLWH